MSECIEGMFKYISFKNQQKCYKEYVNRNKCSKNLMNSNDSVIRDIYKSCSNYAADYVINSYRTSLISN